ncbi:hypothetical protein GCM10009724_23490 [Microbacterium lacticum]|nr:hypothetical protein MLA01_23210 [Microbacterium lacticum]GGI71864.1 hypothetical protein GCM10009724_23490 [Microbacterium lacticum]
MSSTLSSPPEAPAAELGAAPASLSRPEEPAPSEASTDTEGLTGVAVEVSGTIPLSLAASVRGNADRRRLQHDLAA